MTALGSTTAALATRWAALPAFAGLVEVVHGAPTQQLDVGSWLFVEHDGSPDSREDSRFETTWSDLAGTRIEERGEITCSAIYQTGDDDVAVAEAAAVALVTACVADLAADRTVGGVVHATQVTAGRAVQLKNGAGTAVVIPFTVAYFASYAAA